MKKSLLLTLASLSAVAIAVPAQAEVRFNGFGQVVAGSTLGNDHPFPGTAYDSSLSFRPESLFALQVQAPLTDKLSATAQLVASGGENDFRPKFQWAYVTYQADDHWSIKGGRMREPLFRYSDFLQVGAAYPWVRPPVSVYNSSGADSYDGLSLNGLYDFGNWELRPQLAYGALHASLDTTTSGTVTLDQKNLVIGALDVSYDDWLSLRASYMYIPQNSVDVPAVDSIVNDLQANGYTAAAADLGTHDDATYFGGVGFEINRNHYTLSGEYTFYNTMHTAFGKARQYYVSAGYHWNKFTPTLTYGHQDQKSAYPGVVSEVPVDAPDYLYPTVAGFVGAQHAISDYYEAGIRYDISRNTALKADFTRYMSGISGVPGADLVSTGFVFTF